MSDITDQDRRDMLKWAEDVIAKGDASSPRAQTVAQYVRATVDAPATTLAEELREQASWADEMGGPVHGSKFRALADRTEQMERERNTLEQQRDYWCDSEHQAITERDEARAEEGYWKGYALDRQREGERLTEENTQLRMRLTAWRTSKESLPVDQQSNCLKTPNSSTPNPADVPPGEAWIVEVFGEQRTAAKDRTDYLAWNTVSAEGILFPEQNEDVTLIARLVPAPRVIINADDLDQVKRRTVIRDAAGVVCERDAMGDYWTTFTSLANQKPHIEFPVTVLWEPEA